MYCRIPLDEPFSIFAPAKINLRLEVVGRRDDGYHELRMLNVQADFGDEIEMTLSSAPGVSIETTGVEAAREPEVLNSSDKNTAARAARLFLDEFSINCGAVIRIEKKIPMGAGLGGGSADAGAVLSFLHGAFFGPLSASLRSESERRLLKIAEAVGADVPYCLIGGAALVGGVGENVAPCVLDGADGLECLIFAPRFRIETKRIFQLYRIKYPVIKPQPSQRGLASLESLRENMWRGMIKNDLEELVVEHAPDVGRHLASLRAIPGAAAAVTGSGSAFFALPLAGSEFSLAAAQAVHDAFTDFDGQRIRTRLIAAQRAAAQP